MEEMEHSHGNFLDSGLHELQHASTTPESGWTVTDLCTGVYIPMACLAFQSISMSASKLLDVVL